jgi:competence protein ComFC
VNNYSNKIEKFLLDLFFPKFCLGCKTEGAYLCDDCRALLDIAEHNYCLCNSKPIRLTSLNQDNAHGKCPRCQSKNLSGLYFALAYKEDSLVKKLIYNFKYKPYLKDLAKTLASILVEHFIISKKNTNDIWENSVLIPVPLDKKKLKIRGYNQSEELSKELSKILQIPVVSDILVKTKFTKTQMESTKEEREINLQGVFAINKNCMTPDVIQFSKIFLVDDVYTTGSTMQECAKILKEAGAKSVWGIAIAREG